MQGLVVYKMFEVRCQIWLQELVVQMFVGLLPDRIAGIGRVQDVCGVCCQVGLQGLVVYKISVGCVVRYGCRDWWCARCLWVCCQIGL